MGNVQLSNRKSAWGDKEHERTHQGYVNSLVNRQDWKTLTTLLTKNPEHAQVIDKNNLDQLPIHRAILKGASFELIEKLIEVYPDGLSHKDQNNMTPLHYVCIYNFCLDKFYYKLRHENISDSTGHVLKLVLTTRPLEAKETDNDGRTPLHVAAQSKACADAIRELLKYHGDGAARRTKAGKLPLHYALENRASAEAVKVIIEAYPNGIGESSLRKNPLHCACENRASVETIQILVESYPAGVQEKSVESMLPIHLACANKQSLETIELLLHEWGESIYNRDINSRLPLHHALEKSCCDAVILHLIKTAPDTAKISGYYPHLPLHLAIEKIHSFDVIKCLLLAHPSSAGERDMFGILPLRRVIKMKGEEDVVMAILLAHPAAATELDEFDRLTLHYACGRRMSKEIMLALIEACPTSCSVPDKNGQLPLHLSVMRSASTDVLSLLLDRFPAGVMVMDNYNYLPLHHAIELDASLEVHALLLKSDSSCAGIRIDGKPPLHYALEMRRPEKILRLLLNALPSVCGEKESELGRLPLCLAMERMLPIETLLLLCEFYPVTTAAFESDLAGRLPIHYAVEYDAPVEIVRLLLEAHPTVVAIKDLPFYFYEDPGGFMDSNTQSYIIHGKSKFAHDEEVKLASEKQAEDSRLAALRAKNIAKKNVAARLSNLPKNEAFAYAQSKTTENALDGGLDREASNNKGKEQKDAEYNERKIAQSQIQDHWEGRGNTSPPYAAASTADAIAVQDNDDANNKDKSEKKSNDNVKYEKSNSGYDNNAQPLHPVSIRKKQDNHGDIGNSKVPNKHSLSVVWDDKYQRSRPLSRRPGKMLIHYATEDMHSSAENVAAILSYTMPISADTGLAVIYHGYGWTYLLSETQDQYVRAVDLLLDMYTSDIAFIQLLCDSPNEAGLLACEVATPRCLQAIMARLHYFSRYQIAQGDVAHQSQNSIVRLAIDHGHLFEDTKLGKEKKAGSQAKASEVPVALKFMKYREQYDREVQLRASIAFNPKFVIPVLCSHDSDADPAYKKETVDKGLAAYPYLITMAAAERDLLGSIQHEFFSGVDFTRVKIYAKQILEALEHIHSEGLLHGDVKPLNIVRSKGRFKLIDLGSSVRFGQFAGESKNSTAYMPPEMVFKKIAAFANELESGENETKQNYFSQHEAQDYTLSSTTGLPVFPSSSNRIGEELEVVIDHGTNFDPVLAAKKKEILTKEKAVPTVEVLPAHESMDMWSFGVTLFLMATGENLFQSDINDNIDLLQQTKVLASFPDTFKASRLSKCADHWTRNLIFQCLSLDPTRRPTASEALNHPYFNGVPENIASVYRMPGQTPKYDVCICYSTKEHAKYRRNLRHSQFRARVDAQRIEKERIDAEEVAKMQADHAKSKNHFLQIDFKPTSPPWVEPIEPEYIDMDQEEEVAFVEERLLAMGLSVCHCEGGKGLLMSHVALVVLSRNCINNLAHPQQNFLQLYEDSDFEPYYFEIRLALEMQAQSYLEGGFISLAVGDKEEGEPKLKRLMAEKATRDRANAIEAERERAKFLALEKDNKRKDAAAKSRAKKSAKMLGKDATAKLGKAGVSLSPDRGRDRGGGGGSGLSPSHESKNSNGNDGDDNSVGSLDSQATTLVHDKFFADEEAIRNMSLSPSYLPYYASFENEIIGKYGGAHPAGDLSIKPVKNVEQAVCQHLKHYFLGKVPIISGRECSPAKIMIRITYGKQVLVMGEQKQAWDKACTQVYNAVKGIDTPVEVEVEGEEDGKAEEEEPVETNEARAEAIAKFLRQKIVMKNAEIALLESQMEAAQKQMQDRVDELHSLHKKYSIF